MNKEYDLKVVPTLIVGFGGTGALGVQYVKQKINKRLQRHRANKDKDMPRKIPFIEYIVLDTTIPEHSVSTILGDEFFNIGHKNISRIIREIDRNSAYQRALKWFPRHIKPGQIDSGARGIRHIGRLCFFLSKNEIEQQFRNKIQRITDYGAIDKALKEYFTDISLEPGSTIDVHLVTSLCGGTGSSCLLDAAYLIKHHIEDITTQGANVTAHLVTTEPFDIDAAIGPSSREYIHYNFAVTLAEIERFTNFDVSVADSAFSSKSNIWDVEYLDGSVISAIEKPFSLICLLGNKEGETLAKGDICEMIGETIALTTVHPENRLIKGLIDNVKAHVINEKDSTGRMKSYSSYNTRVLSARFNEETISASIMIACKTTLSCLSSDNFDYGAIAKAYEKFSNAAEIDVLTIKGQIKVGFSRERISELWKEIKNQIDVGIARFQSFQTSQNRNPGKLRVRRERHGDRDYLNEALGQYTKVKLKFEPDANLIKRSIKDWFKYLKDKIDEQMVNLLRQRQSFLYLVALLDMMKGELQEVIKDSEQYKVELGHKEEFNDEKMRASIPDGFQDFARRRLNYDIYFPLLDELESQLKGLSNYVEERKGSCHKNLNCLQETQYLLKEIGFKGTSFTEQSIWTRDKITEQIKEYEDSLITGFLNKIDEAVIKESQEHQKEAPFWYLNKEKEKRRDAVYQILTEVADKVVKSEIQREELFLNPDGNGSRHPELEEPRIRSFVSLAAPVWQIERAGKDIANISVTNCPRNTIVGGLIHNIGQGSIVFNEQTSRNGNDKITELFVFRSEHGASTDNLINIRKCLKDVRNKLRMEKKEDINDLCLDRNWRIEYPIPTERAEEICFLFTLGVLFELIFRELDAYYFKDIVGDKVELSSNAESKLQTARRYKAFEQFYKLYFEEGSSVVDLTQKIKAEWEKNRQDSNVRSFREKLEQHLQLLEKDLNEEDVEYQEKIRQLGDNEVEKEKYKKPYDDERKQYEKEMACIKDQINSLGKYIEQVSSEKVETK